MIVKIIGFYGGWLRSLDIDRPKTTSSYVASCAVGVLGTVGIWTTGYLPGPADFFKLRGLIPLILLFSTIVLAVFEQWRENRNEQSLYTFGLITLSGACCFQVFMWSLVSFSTLPGAMVMAAFPILLTSFHGHLYQSSLRYPFTFIISVISVFCAYLFNHDREHIVIYSVAAPMALGTHLLLGYFAGQDSQIRKEHEQMRAAIDAQILSERTGDLNRINQILNEFKGTNHDAGNALSGVMLNLPLFQKIVQEPGLSKEKLDKAAKIAEMLNLSLQNLKDLLQTSRDKIRSHANDLSYIYPHQIITQVIEELQMQFPLITFSYDIELSLKSLKILFFGGNTALTRIFNNILLNACQGNGLESATTIEVTTLFLADCNELVFKILDNGPGFTSLYLNKATQIYSTTKVNGSGLGLYTTRQLLLANNSSITLCNRDDAKGALVTIHLSLERSS